MYILLFAAVESTQNGQRVAIIRVQNKGLLQALNSHVIIGLLIEGFAAAAIGQAQFFLHLPLIRRFLGMRRFKRCNSGFVVANATVDAPEDKVELGIIRQETASFFVIFKRLRRIFLIQEAITKAKIDESFSCLLGFRADICHAGTQILCKGENLSIVSDA